MKTAGRRDRALRRRGCVWKRSLLVLVVCLSSGGYSAISLAQAGPADVLAQRFIDCLEAEGGEWEGSSLEGLAESLAPLAAEFGGEDCESNPDVCAALIEEVSCDDLAGDLEPSVLPEFEPPPEWVATYVDAILGRVAVCHTEETGETLEPESTAALERWSATMGGALGAFVSGPDCAPAAEDLDACTGAVSAIPCGEFAAGLGGGSSGLTEMLEPCAELFDCGDVVDDIMRQEHTVVE